MPRAKPQPAYKDDPRTRELVRCVLFALNHYPNRPIADTKTLVIKGMLHDWFREAIEGAGYTLTDAPTPPKPSRRRKGVPS